jgi:ferrous iron transport protein A
VENDDRENHQVANNLRLFGVDQMHLSDMDSGNYARVVCVDGGKRLTGTLRQYGFYPGEQIRVIRIGPFGGPVLVEINQREVALGRKVAGKVWVELDTDRNLDLEKTK